MNYIEEMESYIVESDRIIKGLFFAISPLYNAEQPLGQNVTVPLFTVLHSTSESILILLLNRATYDSDVLLRTLMEGTIKYCYLMKGNEEERTNKLKEYQTVLTEIDNLSDHKKALDSIDILKQYSNAKIAPFEAMLVDEKTYNQLEAKYPSKTKRQIKGKWGYQAILRNLASEHTEYQDLLATLSTYALSSHYCHFDWTGVSMMQEGIKEAATADNDRFDIAHALKITSNVLSLYLFRVSEYIRQNRTKSSDAAELIIKGLKLVSDMDAKNNSIFNVNS